VACPRSGVTFSKDDRPTFTEREGALAWDNGQIHAKNPDDAIVNKLVAIAKRLNAEVQGDDGEAYDDDGSTFLHLAYVASGLQIVEKSSHEN
jgi:hypothetical protein